MPTSLVQEKSTSRSAATVPPGSAGAAAVGIAPRHPEGVGVRSSRVHSSGVPGGTATSTSRREAAAGREQASTRRRRLIPILYSFPAPAHWTPATEGPVQDLRLLRVVQDQIRLFLGGIDELIRRDLVALAGQD